METLPNSLITEALARATLLEGVQLSQARADLARVNGEAEAKLAA